MMLIQQLNAFSGPSRRNVALEFSPATRDSLPPCGGGMGWGVVQYGKAVPHRTTPTPVPSPQGGGEESAAPANLSLTPNRLKRLEGEP